MNKIKKCFIEIDKKKIIKILSTGTKTKITNSDVVLYQGNIIIKWNNNPHKDIYKKHLEEFRIQHLINEYDHTLAPMILSYYKNDKKNIIQFSMNNLLTEGYMPIAKLFHKYSNIRPSEENIINIIIGIVRLHKLGIAHKDLHTHNIFFNTLHNKVCFIDYGLAFDTFNLYECSDDQEIDSDEIYYITNLQEKWCTLNFSNLNGKWPKSSQIFKICTYFDEILDYFTLFVPSNRKPTLDEYIEYSEYAYSEDINFKNGNIQSSFKEYNTFIDNSIEHRIPPDISQLVTTYPPLRY